MDTKVAKVAKMGERAHGRRAVARKEAKGKRKVAMEKPENLGRVARQATMEHGVEKEATTFCTPLMKMTVKTLKKQLAMKKICKRGVCWTKVKNEQWQNVISRRDKQKVKKANQA